MSHAYYFYIGTEGFLMMPSGKSTLTDPLGVVVGRAEPGAAASAQLKALLQRAPLVLPPVSVRRSHWYPVHGFPSPYPQGLWPSVTTILGSTIPKPALVPWAKGVALEKVRAVLYGALEQELDSGMTPAEKELAHKAWVDTMIEAARRLPDEVRDEAADFGTRAHQAISAWLGGGPEPEEGSELRPPFTAFRDWLQGSGFEAAAAELPVWNKELGYAGTMDLLLWKAPGEWAVADIKTSNGIYPEMALQVAAYAEAVVNMAEGAAGMLAVSEGYILRLPKAAPEAGKPVLEIKEVADLDRAYEAFAACMKLWQAMRQPMWREEL